MKTNKQIVEDLKSRKFLLNDGTGRYAVLYNRAEQALQTKDQQLLEYKKAVREEVERLRIKEIPENMTDWLEVDELLSSPLLTIDKEVCEHGKGNNSYCEPCGRIHTRV